MTIIEFKVVIFGILILFITFRNGSLFQNHVSNSSEISLTFSNDRVSKLCSWKHVYWRSFINALLLKFLYSRYCIIFTSCLLQKTFISVKVILWKSDDPVSITVEFWNILTYLQWLVQYKKILFHTVDLYRQAKYLARQFGNGYSMLNSADIERLRKPGLYQKYNLSWTRIFKNG